MRSSIRNIITTAVLVLSFIFTGYSQQVINIGIGPCWPKDIRENSNQKTSWNATVEWGRVFDDIVIIGADFDFLWNRYTDETSSDTSEMAGSITEVDSVTSWYNFPVSLFLAVDPISQYRMHFQVRGQIGFNMMAYKQESKVNDEKADNSGFYVGLIGKAGADGIFDIGEHSAVFAGIEQQWKSVKKSKDDSETSYYEQNISGPGIRMGFSFMF